MSESHFNQSGSSPPLMRRTLEARELYQQDRAGEGRNGVE